MPACYPAIEPHERGWLDGGDGQQIYWECCGNPAGRPALHLHGGPGSGCTPAGRRFFDPDRYRIVLFDQRGCGRSRPRASEPDHDLARNTTQHLVADIEAVRRHLGVDDWVILGVSWGSTLALAYAHAHRERVRALVLAAVTTTRRREVEWITEGVGRIFPREWERFAAAVPARLRDRPLVDAYAELLGHPDPEVCEAAARAWCAWEDAHVSLVTGGAPSPRFADPEFRLCFARLVTHYWRHHAFLPDELLLREAHRLDGVPGVLIHGARDVSSPLETAWQLARCWRTSRLVVLERAGHGDATEFPAAIVDALDGFSSL
jgi:proline iminopeptidase